MDNTPGRKRSSAALDNDTTSSLASLNQRRYPNVRGENDTEDQYTLLAAKDSWLHMSIDYFNTPALFDGGEVLKVQGSYAEPTQVMTIPFDGDDYNEGDVPNCLLPAEEVVFGSPEDVCFGMVSSFSS
jgi:hypothetical protein